jgi:hypothetical protein
VTARRIVAVGGIVVALAAAVFLAVLAIDVLRWRGHLERADLRFRAAPADTSLWKPDTTLPIGISEDLLSVRDDVAFRQALQTFRLGRPTEPARNQHDLAVRAQAGLELAGVRRSEPSAAGRSRAATLRGILAFEEARGDPAHAGARLRDSLAQFRDAILLDPGNEDAQYDLELALRLLRTTEEAAQGPARKPGRQRGRAQGAGAGASSNATGY